MGGWTSFSSFTFLIFLQLPISYLQFYAALRRRCERPVQMRPLEDAFEEASQNKRHWDRAGARISLASALLREKPCTRSISELRYQPNSLMTLLQ